MTLTILWMQHTLFTELIWDFCGVFNAFLWLLHQEEKDLMFLVLAHCVFSEIAPTSSIDGRRNQEIT